MWCRGIGVRGCCVDDLTVFEVEAARIVRAHTALLSEGSPHPTGACAFLDSDGTCRIYEDRPYLCRTQGLPLRWFEPEVVTEGPSEFRDIRELNESGDPLETLPESACWSIGHTESALAALQHRADAGAGRRVALRALFSSKGPATDRRNPG